MNRKRNFHLTDDELTAIEQAMRHAERPEVRQRAHALHLLHLGHQVTAVAKMMAVNRLTIYKWHDAWLEQGPAGLARKKGSGRNRAATPEYEKCLHQTLAKTPADYGYEFTVWTLTRLKQHLFNKTGIEMSNRTLSATLKRLGYVYRRPKRSLQQLQDPEAIAAAKVHLEELKKEPPPGPSSSSLWTKQL